VARDGPLRPARARARALELTSRRPGGKEKPIPTFKHILAATDFSDASRAAIELARDMACACGATLTVVHVCEGPGMPPAGPIPYESLAPVAARAQERLEDLLGSLRRACAETTGLVKLGHPADEILAAAAETHADLVVMGTHGRRGLAHAVVGSVAERVVRASPVPVLTVRTRSAR
jgi:nucleotide-binding universal stress UspA family protein